jgi:hypothetical protein
MWSSTGQTDSANKIKKAADSVGNTGQLVFVCLIPGFNTPENKISKVNSYVTSISLHRTQWSFLNCSESLNSSEHYSLIYKKHGAIQLQKPPVNAVKPLED